MTIHGTTRVCSGRPAVGPGARDVRNVRDSARVEVTGGPAPATAHEPSDLGPERRGRPRLSRSGAPGRLRVGEPDELRHLLVGGVPPLADVPVLPGTGRRSPREVVAVVPEDV